MRWAVSVLVPTFVGVGLTGVFLGSAGCDLVFGPRLIPVEGGEGEGEEGEGEEGEGEEGEGEGEGERAPAVAWAVDNGRIEGVVVARDGTVFIAVGGFSEGLPSIVDLDTGETLPLPKPLVAASDSLIAIRDGVVLWVATAVSDNNEAFNQTSINEVMFVDGNNLYIGVATSDAGSFIATDQTVDLDANRNIILAIDPDTGALNWTPLNDYNAAPTSEIPLTLLPDGVVVAVQFVGDDPFAGQFETAEPGPTAHQGVAIAKLRANDGSVQWHRMIESGTTPLIDGLNLAHPVLAGAPDSGVYVSLETRGSPETVRPFGGLACASANTPAANDTTTTVVLRFDGDGACVFAAAAAEPAGGALDDFSSTSLVGLDDRAVLINKSSGGNRSLVSTQYSSVDGATLGTPALEDVESIAGAFSLENGDIRVFAAIDAFDDPSVPSARFALTDLLPLTADRDDFFLLDANSDLSTAIIQHHIDTEPGADTLGMGSATAGPSAVILRDAGPTVHVDGQTFETGEALSGAQIVVFLP